MSFSEKIDLVKTISNRSAIFKIQNDNRYYFGKFCEEFSEEIKILKACSNCEYINSIKFFTEFDKKLVCLQQFYSCGTLHNKLANDLNLASGQIQNIAKQLLLGVDYLHKNSIIHRNINFKSILCTDNSEFFDIKLAGFSYAMFYNEIKPPVDKCGEPGYQPPEMIKSKPQSLKSDIWMYGVTIYRLLANTNYPFKASGILACIKKMKQSNISYNYSNFISLPMAKDFIKLTLKYKKIDRPSSSTLLQNSYLTVANYTTFKTSKVPYIEFRI